jgi:hypothetical protein
MCEVGNARFIISNEFFMQDVDFIKLPYQGSVNRKFGSLFVIENNKELLQLQA